ncbi:hypothetical protein B566_EDAN015090 [Ephemera danica]|nr:hypothetical protein B566_EDAN015090 [Ephemera danica]
MAADETAPQHVLLPVSAKQQPKQDEKKKEEQRKYGIFFDDNYDYLQHLRPAGDAVTEWEPVEKFRITKSDGKQASKAASEAGQQDKPSRLQLPSSVFASHVEEDVGLLNRAAPQSAAMDEDFNYDDPENVLEDNFMEIANAEIDEDGFEEGSDGSWTDESDDNSGMGEDEDDVMSLNGPQMSFTGEETKSRFTEYSMTSSVIRRNNQLTLLDSRFEQMFTAYDDTEIGALDCDEIEGHVAPDSKLILQCAEQFERETEKAALEAAHQHSGGLKILDSESEDDMPKLIRVSAKTGIPVGVLSERKGLTARALASLDAANGSHSRDDDSASVAISVLSALSIRPKGESPAERQARKQALKEYRKERRMERKSNKIAFKEEKKKQEKLVMHNRNCANVVKIV